MQHAVIAMPGEVLTPGTRVDAMDRGTMARTATHAGSLSGDTVGDSSPGVTAHAWSMSVAGTS